MGINPGTTEYLIGKYDGVFSCATIRRLPDDEAFGPAIIDDIKVRYRDDSASIDWYIEARPRGIAQSAEESTLQT